MYKAATRLKVGSLPTFFICFSLLCAVSGEILYYAFDGMDVAGSYATPALHFGSRVTSVAILKSESKPMA